MKNLEKFTLFCLYGLTLTPLIFVGSFYFPFVIVKTLYFRLLLEGAVVGYVFLLLRDFGKYRPRMNYFLILSFGWVSALFASSALGLNFYKSFWGSFERMEGVVYYLYLWVFIFLLFNVLKTKKQWTTYIRILLFVSFASSFYALIQKYSLLPVFEAGLQRVAGTLGNAAFLAGYLLLALILGIFQFTREKNKNIKYAILAGSILNFIVLFMTSTRGAILGILAGMVVFLILNIVWQKGKIKAVSAGFLFLVILSGGIFYLQRDNLIQSDIQFVKRLASISIDDATTQNRLLSWKYAVSGWQERPILGWGAENYNVVYNKYFSPLSSEDWFDRSHNVYLDLLVHGGILNLGLYLAIWGIIFIKLFKYRKEDFAFFAIFSAGLSAYAVHNFFVFDVLSTSFVFFFILSFIYNRDYETENGGRKNLAKYEGLIKFFTLSLAITVFYFAVFQPFKINKNIRNGYYYTIADPELSYEKYSQAIEEKYARNETSSQVLDSFKVLREREDVSDDLLLDYFNLAKKGLDSSLDVYYYDIRPRLHRAEVGLVVGADEEEKEEIKKYLNQAIELSPSRPESYYFLLNYSINEGDNKKAKQILENYIEKESWFGEPKIKFAEAFHSLYPEEAEKYFYEGLKQFYRPSEDNYRSIISFLTETEKWGELPEYYLKLIEIRPKNYDYRVDLSKVYWLLDQKEKAVEQLNIVFKKSPEILQKHSQYLNLIRQEMPEVLDF